MGKEEGVEENEITIVEQELPKKLVRGFDPLKGLISIGELLLSAPGL